MRKLFKNKVFIIFLFLFVGVGGLLIWGAFQAGKTGGIISIPEIEAEEILKGVYLRNNTVAGESVMITYSGNNLDMTHYVMLKFANDKSLDELRNTSSFDSRTKLYRQGYSGFTFWNYPEISEKVDFKYHYTNEPVLQEELSDTVLVQNFDNANIEISLTDEQKRDVGLEIKKPATVVLYKKDKYLYFIYVIRPYDQENKWVSREELEKTLYPLVKNWGIW